MNAKARKLAAAGVVALMSVGAVAMSSSIASAHDYRYYGGYARPVTWGIVGAVSPPLFAAPYAYAPGPGCHMMQAPAYDEWGRFVGYGPLQVCE